MSWQELTDRVAETVVNTFTTVLTYTPASGSPKTLNGVFDAAFVEVEILDGAQVQSIGPRVFLRASDLDAPPKVGDRLTINGTQYRINENRPDGEAGYLLLLHKL